MKEHLRWTLWPMSSGAITGRDGSEGLAAENTQRLENSLMLYEVREENHVSPWHRPLTSCSPGGQSLGPRSGATEKKR